MAGPAEGVERTNNRLSPLLRHGNNIVTAREALTIPHVRRIERVHAWSLDGERHVFSARIVMRRGLPGGDIASAREQLRTRHEGQDFVHIALEVVEEEDRPAEGREPSAQDETRSRATAAAPTPDPAGSARMR